MKHENLLAIDHGQKKIGLAIAETDTKIATPFKIIENTSDLLANISKICQDENIDKVIVGVPVGLQGTMSEQAIEVIKFIKKLRESLDIEIIEQDEKLTSIYAQKLMQETGKKTVEDDVAAMLILQSYLDSLFGV